MAICICGVEFTPRNKGHRYHAPECRPKSPRVAGRYSAAPTRFIAVDGEGVTDPDGSHRYVVLSVGSVSLHKDGSSLDHWDIFPFLWRQYVLNPDAAFVGYYLTYDFSQWLKSLPEHEARMLLTDDGIASRQRKNSGGNPTPFPVYIRSRDGERIEWEIDMLGMRRFKLRPHDGMNVSGSSPWMFICDSGPFWQTSFLSAINPKNWGDSPVVTPVEYEKIAAGKAHRADASFDSTMVEYNLLENKVLAETMGRLNQGFLSQRWHLKRQQWFGPGQAADVWLASIDAPTRDAIEAVTPPPVMDAARHTYYGGWFEIPRHGTIEGTSYEYDINSAYPHVIAGLPCLLHGRWVRGASASTSGLVMVYATVTGSDRYLGPLPHRDRHGIISRPLSTVGWYWLHEIDMARRAGLVDVATVLDSWTYIPCECPPPFASIVTLYDQRLRVGKNTAHGKALKLVYNSAYGKFAQSVGSPKYANALYASLITAGCRVQILNAIATHPDRSAAVLMVATDGVYFRNPHPTLDCTPNVLGKWEAGTKQNLTLFMPGVYWDDKARDKFNGTPQLKSRGINASDLAGHIDKVDAQFREWDGEWPSIEIPIRFSVTSPKLALARGKWETCGAIVTDGVKSLSSSPVNKRHPSAYLADGILTTSPYADRGESVPYDKTFGLTLEGLIDNDQHLTDDGSLNREIIELIMDGD